MTDPDPRRAAGYYRVSRARDDMTAPELYRGEIERYCSYRDLDLVKVYEDIDASGFRGAPPRPGLNHLLDDRSRYEVVVIPKLARFGRSMKELIRLFDLFDGESTSLVFLDMDIDTNTSQGRLLRHVMAAFAEYESDVKSDYWRATSERRLGLGLPMSAAPFGYRWSDGTYAMVPRAAAIVRRIFTEYEGGASMLAIVRALNDEGVPPPKARLWSKPTVRNILENHKYIGRLGADGSVEGQWKPIIAEEQWERVHRRRHSVSNRGVAPISGLYLLSGLITCGLCGSTLYHRTRQDRLPGSYTCRGHAGDRTCKGGGVAEHRVNAFVVRAFLERFQGSMIYDPSLSAAPVPVTAFWNQASVEQKRGVLAGAIAKLVMLPWPEGHARGRGLSRGRDFELTWADLPEAESKPALLTDLETADAKTCDVCRRRRHVSNFRKDEMGARVDTCARCRLAAGEAPRREIERGPQNGVLVDREDVKVRREHRRADSDADKRDEQFQIRSERSKKAWREWKEHQRRCREEQLQRSMNRNASLGEP